MVKGVTTGFFGAFTSMSALALGYSGLTLGQTVFAATSMVQGVAFAAGIVAVLLGFLFITTVLTFWTIKLGTRLAGDRK